MIRWFLYKSTIQELWTINGHLIRWFKNHKVPREYIKRVTDFIHWEESVALTERGRGPFHGRTISPLESSSRGFSGAGLSHLWVYMAVNAPFTQILRIHCKTYFLFRRPFLCLFYPLSIRMNDCVMFVFSFCTGRKIASQISEIMKLSL